MVDTPRGKVVDVWSTLPGAFCKCVFLQFSFFENILCNLYISVYVYVYCWYNYIQMYTPLCNNFVFMSVYLFIYMCTFSLKGDNYDVGDVIINSKNAQ